jgi:glutathione peroxidase
MRMDRRQVLAGMATVSLTIRRPDPALAQAAQGAFQFRFDGLDGAPLPLEPLAGRVLLVVNTASRCGFTRQYAGLQELWTRHRLKGLTVIGVPSNDFAGQEPGSSEDIAEFCNREFGVTFPMASRQVVIGASAHPLYQWAARQRADAVPRWNFHKLLIGRDGQLIAAFGSATTPGDPRLVTAIEQALAKPSV